MTNTPTHSAKTVADDLHVSASTVYRWLKNGEIEKHGYTGQKIKSRWVITAIPTSAATVEDAIISAYNALARRPGAPVGLVEVRKHVAAWTRGEVDEALLHLLNGSRISLEPEPNRHRLTAEYRAAAVHIGGEDRHLMQIG